MLVVEDREVSVRLLFETGVGLSWGSEWTSDRILPGDELDPGDRRVSPDGRRTLVVKGDANLVEYCGHRAVFSTGIPTRSSAIGRCSPEKPTVGV